jgi:hypothetical protein
VYIRRPARPRADGSVWAPTGNINPSLNFPVEPMICVPAAAAVHSVGYGRLQDCRARGFMIDRKTIRLSAVLIAAGFIFYVVVGLLHAGGPANNHPVVFAIYASSASWTAVHLGQFVGMAVITAGLLVLYFALDIRAGGAAWVARLGAVSATVALGLYGVLQAVDGVALKQAVNARPSPYKPIRSLNSRRMYCRTSRWRLTSWFTVRPPCLGMMNTLKPHRWTRYANSAKT